MRAQGPLVFLLFLISMSTPISAQKKPRFMTGSAAKGAKSAGMKAAPDLDSRVERFREVRMRFDSAGLSVRERKLVEKLVEACHYLDNIFWRQSDPEALTLYQSLAGSKNPRDLKLRRYLWINASRFDLLEENRPFVGTDPMPPGRGFYPQGLPRAQIEKYVRDHPEKKTGIYSSTTVLRWHGDQLEGLPYHIAYRSFLEPAAKSLREAAKLSADPAFANFLRLRAQALLSDDYFQSDLAWLDLKDPKFDIIFAPYETYLDGLLGVKGSYGAAVLIRNEEESRKLAMFQKYVPEIQDALPLAPDDRPSKRGLETPLEVMDAPFRAGDLTHGYQAVADNLPNDPRVHEEAKADVVGMYGLKWLVDHTALPKQKLEEYYASYVAGIFRTVRFGTGEAHGQAEMMEFNYLAEREAIKRESSGRYAIDYAKIPDVLADLAKELLEIEATGDRQRAENWFKKYGRMGEDLKSALKSASSVPVDIDPVFSFKKSVR